MPRRRPLIAAAAVVLGTFTLACAAGEPPPPTVAPATPPDPVAEPSAAALPAVCTDDCLLLLEQDARDLMKGSYCDTCGGDCPGWPREPLGCDEVDYLRNCMYARLGYTFDKAEEWREVFDKEDWYQPRDDFRWGDVSPLQVRNANWLKKKRERRDCVR